MRSLLTMCAPLLIAVAGKAQYTVEIETDSAVVAGDTVYISVSISPNGTSYELGGFDLDISYEPTRMQFWGASKGSFLTECGWEYFTYRSGATSYPSCCILCPSVYVVQIIAIANVTTPGTPSCFAATGTAEIAKLLFRSNVNASNLHDVFSPIDFYWRNDVNPCTKNTFSSRDGSTTYGVDSAYNAADTTFDSLFNCSGPPDSCPGIMRQFDFYGGGAYILIDTSDRGDFNLNDHKFEIGDAVYFANYFMYGPNVLYSDSAQRARQLVASEINCDGLVLSVADLVRLLRILSGEAFPGPGCYARPTTKQDQLELQASSVGGDTLAFPNASGNPGQQRIPFYVKVGNGQPLAGLQARMTYNPACLSPHLDSAIGDGQSVEFTLLGRAVGFEAEGTVKVYSPAPGIIIIKFFPDMDGVDFPITTGSGNILKFNMDVAVEPPLPATTPVQFVTADYDYNILADEFGNGAIAPVIVNGTFTVTEPPPPPSCPVLFTYDGYEFAQEDVLLTACEASGYKNTVVDYYQVKTLPAMIDGKVTFQIRELEDEITYLENLQLLTIDHSAGSKIACDISGNIFAYDDITVPPISAIDQSGIDRLAEVISADGKNFISMESGFLTLEFPNAGGGFEINAARKQLCYEKANADAVKPDKNILKVEALNDAGEWIEYPTIPSREEAVEEIVMISNPQDFTANLITIRISWSNEYSTDAIRQLVVSPERPLTTEWPIREFKLTNGSPAMRWAGFDNDGHLTLRKGDAFEFSFATGAFNISDMSRDYVIVAIGRFEPDYSIYGGMLPSTVTLFPNYPNPFNPTTFISYSLPEAGDVKLEVYNVLGQRIGVLEDGFKPAGLHRIEWPTAIYSVLPSGVYLYKLTFGDFVETKKMMLVK